MAKECTLYQFNGAYYTAAGWQDYATHRSSPPSDPSEVSATREKVSVSLVDSNAGTLYYSHTGADVDLSHVRTEDGTRVTRRTNDGATSSLEYYLYFVNGSCISVYGAHPAHPGFSAWYTGPGGSVNFVPSNAGRYSLFGAYIHEDGMYETRASGLQSGTAYDADKIVYYNAHNQIFFGANVAKGKRYAVCAGYYWFAMLSSSDITPSPTPNSNTRTIANGKRRALITDIEGYNAGTASAATQASTGSLTFGYWRVMRQNLGDYEPTVASRVLTAVTTTDAATGTAIVLRAVWTGAGRTGNRYAIGADISDIVTRRPSLTVYDSRFALYAEWVHRIAVTFDANGQTTQIYRSVEERKWFADDMMTEVVDRINAPTMTDAVFVGYYTEPTGGEAVTDAQGNILSGYAPEADATVYAHWREVKDCTLDKQGGTGGTSLITYDSEIGGFIIDGGDETRTAISVPTRPQFAFLGYYTLDDRQCITASGEMTEYFLALAADAPSVVYARWQRVSYRLDLEDVEGSVVTSIYCDGSNPVFYLDPALSDDPVDSIEAPVFPGYAFHGYERDGIVVINGNGEIVCGAFAADAAASPSVTANVYEITFDYAEGSGRQASKSVTYGQPIGTLPEVTLPAISGYSFTGWLLDGIMVTADTVYDYANNKTLKAQISSPFEKVEDYFGLGGKLLVCVDSSDGAVRTVVETSHTGKLWIGAGDSNTGGAHKTYGLIINPKCTYRVIGRGDIRLTLGKAYGMAILGESVEENGVTYPTVNRSGYMLTRWVLKTAADGCPVLEVYGTGNEGYVYTSGKVKAKLTDAVNTYPSVVHLDPDHVAQDAEEAVSGGGELVNCETEGRCDPVVPTERGMPCASDVCRGKLIVRATIYDYFNESAPAANHPFVETNLVTSHDENDYTHYDLTAERSL